MQWCRLKTIFSFYLCSKPREGKHISTFLLECSLLSVVLCRNSLSSSHNLPTPQTSSEAKGTFLVLCLLVVYLSFASKIGWRSRENYLITTSRHQLWLCPHNCGKVILVSVELLLVQSVQGKECSLGFSRHHSCSLLEAWPKHWLILHPAKVKTVQLSWQFVALWLIINFFCTSFLLKNGPTCNCLNCNLFLCIILMMWSGELTCMLCQFIITWLYVKKDTMVLKP